jgi:hypothetical protein
MGNENVMKVAPHIDRFGDIRRMLVDYFGNVLLKKDSLFSDDYFKALTKKFGKSVIVGSAEELDDFTDNFIYSYRFPDERTVFDRFVAETSGLREEEKAIVLKWNDPVVGIFQIKKILPDGIVAENLINEVDYTIKPTLIPRQLEEVAVPGAFFEAKIIPAGDKEYTFSGAQSFLDGSEMEILQRAASLQREHPALAFRDNEERIRWGFELQKRERALFIEYFGGDEVLTEGKKLNEIWSGFMKFKMDRHDKPIPEGYNPPQLGFPKNLIRSRDVGIVFEEDTGQHYLINFGSILDVFRDPDESKIRRFEEEILIYLEEDSIPPGILRRIFFRYPQNAEFITRKVLNRPDFDLQRDFDSLMDEFKPSFKSKRIYPQMLPMSDRMVKAIRPEINQQQRSEAKIGRNAPCPCGSGKKYKKCCGK